MPTIFKPQIAEKINRALSVRVLLMCSDRIDFYGGALNFTGIDCALKLDEYILHKNLYVYKTKIYPPN